MNFIGTTIIIAILSMILQAFLPWWSIAIAAALVALFSRVKPALAFLSGLIGIALVWLLKAWLLDWVNDGILSAKMAQILPVGSAAVLLLVTVLTGGLVGGFAALTGSSLRRLFVK